MKISIVCEGYPSPGYPMMVFVEQLVNTMIDLGVDIDVIAPQSITNCIVWHKPILPYKNIAVTPQGHTYIVYRPKYISLGKNVGLKGKIFKKVKQNSILRTLKKVKQDVVYAHFWEFACYTAGYCQKKHLPLFVACGEGDNALEEMVEESSMVYIDRLREAVTGVISVSSENKRKCIQYHLAEEKDITVLPNCVNTDMFKPGDGSQMRRKLGIQEGDYVISFVGGFIERKGANRLAQAITSLHDEKIKSIFIGKPMGSDVAIPECEGIVFKGALDHDQLPEYLNSSDVFVLPTQKEGCSNAIVEALACGLPVISSDGPFNDDILTEDNSIRIHPDDVEALAEAIKTMRDRGDEKQRLSEQIGKENPYSLATRASRIIQFIKMKI